MDFSTGDGHPTTPPSADPSWQLRRSPTDLAPVPAPGTSRWRMRLFGAPASDPNRRKVSHRAFFGTVGSLLLLAVLFLIGTSLWLRHSMTANLPQIDGALSTPGLTAPVTVVRDEHGVPSITAVNLDDLVFAQGFVTAQDRLWQMDALRRHAAGTLAELLGPSLLQHDRTQRVLRLDATADSALLTLDPAERHQLDCYARGVNAFITQNHDRLPVEFHLLHYDPAPWTPRDSILVSLAMAQDLSTVFPTKLLREAFSHHFPAALLPDLYPVGGWRDHPPGAAIPDLTSPKPEIEQIPLDESQASLRQSGAPSFAPNDEAANTQLITLRNSLLPHSCAECRDGSNNWAVAGARSASGKPLVSNDMHLQLAVPDTWYSASLRTADNSFSAAGVTLPGVPFVIVGRNAHVAWGITAMLADTQDIYIEHVRGTGPDAQYQAPDGTWQMPLHHHELIRVRGSADTKLDVVTTQHHVGSAVIETPVLTPLYPQEHRTLALAWTLYDTTHFHIPFYAANAAADGSALIAALGQLTAPSLSIVWADDQNHIGFHGIGHVPIRGPAVQHPRALPDAEGPVAAPPDEAPEGASLTTPRFAQRQPALLPVVFAARRRAKAAPAPQPADDIPAAPPARNFTIGSPIPAVPVDALDPNAAWSGYIPYDQMPAALDPPEGVLATANSRITPDDYPYAIALDWAPAVRVDRILRTLTARTNLTPADMLALEMDVHSELDLDLAQRFAYAVDQANVPPADKARLRSAADILRRWNGDVTPDEAAFAIVTATRGALWRMLLDPQIRTNDHLKSDAPVPGIFRLYSWQQSSYAFEQLIAHQPARWLPPGYTSWNDLIVAAMVRGLRDEKAPANLSTWSFSRLYPIELSHQVLGSPFFAHVLGTPTTTGPRVIGGNGLTVKAVGHSFGPSERFTADLASPDTLALNITTGESGNPISPWFLDQLPLWLGGQTLTLRLGPPPQATHTLTLQP